LNQSNMAAPSLVSAPRRLAPRRAAAAVVLSICGVLALDAVLFRTPFYISILEPDSSSGIFELVLRREREAQGRYGDNVAITLGDSRFAYSPKQSNELTDRTGLVLRHAGIAGSTARAWYYMLRDLDPTASRYRAVVLGVTDYDDEDELYNPNDDIRTLHYVIARLRWSDVPEFALSFDSLPARWQAFRGSLLKGTVLQRDFREFLTNPEKRLKYIALCREGYEGWTYNFEESTRSMAGLSIDWSKAEATFPAGADDEQRETVKGALLPRAQPQTGRYAAFRRKWLGRIVDRYRGSKTRVVIVRLPRGAVPRPEGWVKKLSSSVREFERRPNVLLAPEHAFDSLERPELFRDAIHLNREGIARFSPMLAEELARTLAR